MPPVGAGCVPFTCPTISPFRTFFMPPLPCQSEYIWRFSCAMQPLQFNMSSMRPSIKCPSITLFINLLHATFAMPEYVGRFSGAMWPLQFNMSSCQCIFEDFQAQCDLCSSICPPVHAQQSHYYWLEPFYRQILCRAVTPLVCYVVLPSQLIVLRKTCLWFVCMIHNVLFRHEAVGR